MIVLKKVGLKVFCEYESDVEEDYVKKATSFFMDGAEFSSKFQDGYWDGKIRYYNKTNKSFWFGLIGKVEKRLEKEGVLYVKEGFGDRDISWVKFSELFLTKERDYQRKGMLEWLKRTYGILKVPTRGGKTYIAAELMRLIQGENPDYVFCFLVDSSDLYRQATKDIAGVMGMDEKDIGQIRGDKFDIKAINVAMVQTVQSALSANQKSSKAKKERKREMAKFLESVDMLTVDEVQEYGSSNPRISVLRRCKDVEYMLGISATPFKKTNKIERINVESITGGLLYEIKELELVDRKVLAESKALLLLMEHPVKLNHTGATYDELYKKVIIENEERDDVMINTIEICHKLDLKTMVLFSSVSHGKIVERSTGYPFVYGDHSDEERDTAKRKFLKGKGGILLVSDIWKKGITLPEVEVMFNADGGKEQTMIIQRRGRVLGVTEDKTKALSIDFVDDYPSYFNNHSLERIEAYEGQIGMKNLDVLDVADVDFLEDMEDYLINWFEINIAQ